MELNVIKHDGSTSKTITVLDDVFKSKVSQQPIYDVVIAKNASLRQGTHSTKKKGEVSGGGKKPWRQKGTGRARAGSTRSPIWVGGGVAFGPTPEKNYTLKVNKKVYKNAMRSALTLKAQENGLVVVEPIKLETPSTKKALEIIANLKLPATIRKTLVVTDDAVVFKSLGNVPNIEVCKVTSLDVKRLLHFDVVLLEAKHIEYLQEVLK